MNAPLPAPHVLYRFYNSDHDLLYIGITCNPHARFRAHQIDKEWWREVDAIKVENFDSRETLAMAERTAILAERPRYNIKDTHPRGLYSISEVIDECDLGNFLKRPELFVRKNIRKGILQGVVIDGQHYFTRRQIQKFMAYYEASAVLERRRLQRSA